MPSKNIVKQDLMLLNQLSGFPNSLWASQVLYAPLTQNKICNSLQTWTILSQNFNLAAVITGICFTFLSCLFLDSLVKGHPHFACSFWHCILNRKKIQRIAGIELTPIYVSSFVRFLSPFTQIEYLLFSTLVMNTWLQ